MNNPTPTSPAAYRAMRLARALGIYGLLLGGSVIFLFPFLWLLGTSFKVDRELMSEEIRLWPGRPVPAAQSPWVDPGSVVPPRHANPAGPEVVARLLADLPVAWPEGVCAGADAEADRRRALSDALWSRLAATLPPDAAIWDRDRLRDALRGRATAEGVAEAQRRITRVFQVGALRARSVDTEEADLTAGRSAADVWQVSGPARLTAAAGPAGQDLLAYDFSAPGRDRVVLDARFELPFDVARLQRLELAYTPDDSWHRVDVEIEMGGVRYRARRPEFLANALPAAWTFQPYGPDDHSTKIRYWNPLMKVAAGAAVAGNPRAVRMRLTLRENSAAGAWWAKCQRNYIGALTYIPFWRYAATSLFLVVLNVTGTLFASSLVAFAFARLRWPGRDIVFGLMLATMMIPGQVTMIPHFLITRSLGWYNTLTPLWFGSLFGNAFSIFLLRQFMKGIPRDLEDAARIDGCSSWQVYWHVVLPLVKPTLACIAIFTFMGVWNDFMGPLIYLTDQRLYPLSLGLYALNVQAGGNTGMMMASACLMTLPVVMLFFFAQKYFIQGITLTGMKG